MVPLRQRHDERAQTTAHYPRRPTHWRIGPAQVADSSVDLVRQAARVSGGAAHFFYAPTVVHDPATARALRQPEVARTFGRLGSVTKAVVGIGLWAPGESTVYDVTDEKVRGVSCAGAASVAKSQEY